MDIVYMLIGPVVSAICLYLLLRTITGGKLPEIDEAQLHKLAAEGEAKFKAQAQQAKDAQ